MNIEVKGFCHTEGDLYDLWKTEGLNMHHYLRGDFLVTIYDKDETIYISDFAGSKSSYKIPRNSTIAVKDNKIVYRKDNITTTDLFYAPPQGQSRRNDYDKLFAAIDDAIKIRIPNEPYTLSLSSGHDSGAIATGCIRLNEDPQVLYAYGNENHFTLNKRITYFDSTEFSSEHPTDAHALLASNVKTKVLLSGLGADELYVSGDFELMETFYADAHRGYDHFNLDVRFPLSDPNVYREYMLLDGRLVGRDSAKIPLEKYMETINFPINDGKKASFYLW